MDIQESTKEGIEGEGMTVVDVGKNDDIPLGVNKGKSSVVEIILLSSGVDIVGVGVTRLGVDWMQR